MSYFNTQGFPYSLLLGITTLTVREPLSIEIGQSFTVTWYNYFNCKGTPEYRNRTEFFLYSGVPLQLK
jgi:hypothetical protein